MRPLIAILQLLRIPGFDVYTLTGDGTRLYTYDLPSAVVNGVTKTSFENREPALVLDLITGTGPSDLDALRPSVQFMFFGGSEAKGDGRVYPKGQVETLFAALRTRLLRENCHHVTVDEAIVHRARFETGPQYFEHPTHGWPVGVCTWKLTLSARGA